MRRSRRDRAGRRSITSWPGVRVANAGMQRILTPLTPSFGAIHRYSTYDCGLFIDLHYFIACTAAPDLVPPRNSAGPGFPNRGQSLRQMRNGTLLPYYDRGQILDGALDGQHLEICWIKDQMDALLIQIQGSARVRLEDGTMLRINYAAHNGYPNVPIGRILIERNIIPREAISLDRIREWMRANPQSAEEVLRQNRSFTFFRIVGLSDDREAVGAQGVPLTSGRSIAIDNSLHVYGTPFFIQARLPLTNEKRTASFARLMIAQDTGSAIVGPARADIYLGAGDQAGQLAGRVHHSGNFAMLVPRELDPVATGAQVPLPPEKPPAAALVSVRTPAPKSPTSCQHLRQSLRDCRACRSTDAGLEPQITGAGVADAIARFFLRFADKHRVHTSHLGQTCRRNGPTHSVPVT